MQLSAVISPIYQDMTTPEPDISGIGSCHFNIQGYLAPASNSFHTKAHVINNQCLPILTVREAMCHFCCILSLVGTFNDK
jgi:hypothetical protein